MPSDQEILSWIEEIRVAIGKAADERQVASKEFAATLVAVIAGCSETLVVHIGDGAAALLIDGTWEIPSWPAHGEYASTTFFVTDKEPRVQIERTPVGSQAVAVFSDGLERLVLNFRENVAHAPFFERMLHPVVTTELPGRNAELSAHLMAYLDQPAVNARTDDDKTLIIAAR